MIFQIAFVCSILSRLLSIFGLNDSTNMVKPDTKMANIRGFEFFGYAIPNGKYDDLYCGATLISPLFVISAYYCVTLAPRNSTWLVNFYVNDHCQSDSEHSIRVTDVHFLEDAEVTRNLLKHDVALLKLAKKMKKIEPAALPTKPPEVGQVGMVIGYEVTQRKAGSNFDSVHCQLRRNQLTILKDEVCNDDDMIKRNFETVVTFCSYDPDRQFASCKSGSGAPWVSDTHFSRKVLVGISTFGGFDCEQEEINGLYTSVFQYKEWITTIIRKYDKDFIAGGRTVGVKRPSIAYVKVTLKKKPSRDSSSDEGDGDNNDDEDSGSEHDDGIIYGNHDERFSNDGESLPSDHPRNNNKHIIKGTKYFSNGRSWTQTENLSIPQLPMNIK